MKAIFITGIVVFGGVTIFALAQGQPVELALATGLGTVSMAAGAVKS